MKDSLSFYEVQQGDTPGLFEVERLAREIWSEHYTSIIGQDQVAYMLDSYQSSAAVRSQIGEGFRYFLLEWQGRRVGYFAVHLVDHGSEAGQEMSLSKLYVLASCRGHGLGRRSLECVEALAREAGVSVISLMVNKGNRDSIRFYEQQGFLSRGPIIKDIGAGFVMDDFLYEKTLA